MTDFVTLSCPSCGGKLEITKDIERFACAHCGQEHIVRRSGGIVSLSPVVDALNKVGVGVDKTAAELAIVRLQKEIDTFQVAKANLLQSSPQPTLNPLSILSIFLLVLGFLLSCLMIFGMANGGGGSSAVILVVFDLLLLAGGGWGLLPLLPNTKKRWQNTTGAQLKYIDDQIAIKSAELQRYQKVVSQQ